MLKLPEFIVVWNNTWLQYLNNLLSYQPENIQNILYILSDLPVFFMPLFLMSMWLWNVFFFKQNTGVKKRLLFVFISSIIGIITSTGVQQIFDIARPETALTATQNIIFTHPPTASFPSDHATMTVAFLFALLFFRFYHGFWVYFPLVYIMLLARTMGGIHWPFDIIVGSFLGFFIALFLYYIRNFLPLQKFLDFLIKTSSKLKL